MAIREAQLPFFKGKALGTRLREALSERGPFFRSQVYERVEISLVEVYERAAKSVIAVCERTYRANRRILWQ